MPKRPRRFNQKPFKDVPKKGVVHVRATFNNTIITITDDEGNTFFSISAGRAGFSGSRKSTAYAAQTATRKLCARAFRQGMREIEIWVRGPGLGRKASLRALRRNRLKILRIKDKTSKPHNGCRLRKQRR